MNSSKTETRGNLAGTLGPSKLLDGISELANLRDDPPSFERFARRWPVFAPIWRGEFRVAGVVCDDWPTGMPPGLPKRFFLIWQQREKLREIWRGNSNKLTEVLLASLDEIYEDPDPEGPWPRELKVDWQRGEFVYVPRREFQRAVYELFRRSPLAKVCGNPDCAAPYFIARKTAQRYCSDGCAQVFQREWKRRWWKEKGSKWRRKKSRGKKGKR